MWRGPQRVQLYIGKCEVVDNLDPSLYLIKVTDEVEKVLTNYVHTFVQHSKDNTKDQFRDDQTCMIYLHSIDCETYWSTYLYHQSCPSLLNKVRKYKR